MPSACLQGGISPHYVHHRGTLKRAGGGFRSSSSTNDYMLEACAIANRFAPVKLLWTREDDSPRSLRPRVFPFPSRWPDASGKLVAWAPSFRQFRRRRKFAPSASIAGKSIARNFYRTCSSAPSLMPLCVPTTPLRAPGTKAYHGLSVFHRRARPCRGTIPFSIPLGSSRAPRVPTIALLPIPAMSISALLVCSASQTGRRKIWLGRSQAPKDNCHASPPIRASRLFLLRLSSSVRRQ